MAETVFTTWSDLLERLKQDLADGAFRKMGQYTVNAGGAGGSFSVSHRSLPDLLAAIEFCKKQAVMEERNYQRFTYPLNLGRG